MKNVDEIKSRKPTWSLSEVMIKSGLFSEKGVTWYKDKPETDRDVLIRSYWDLVYKSGMLEFLVKREREILGIPNNLRALRRKFPLVAYRTDIGDPNEVNLEQGIDNYHGYYGRDPKLVASIDDSVNRILDDSKLPPMYFKIVLFLLLRGQLIKDGELFFYTRLMDSIALKEDYDKRIYNHFTQKEFIGYANLYLLAIARHVSREEFAMRERNLDEALPNFRRKYRPVRNWDTYYKIIKLVLKNYNIEQKTNHGESDSMSEGLMHTSKSLIYDLFNKDLTKGQEQKEAYKLRKAIERLKKEYPFLTDMFPHLQQKA